MNKKILLLLTNEFPYGKGEQFLETEIHYLVRYFDEVRVYPLIQSGVPRELPSTAKVMSFKRGKPFEVRKLLLRKLQTILTMIFTEFLSSNFSKYKKKGFKFHFDRFLSVMNDAENFNIHLKSNYKEPISIYSYWFGPWGQIMSLVNVFSKGKTTFVTRVHGYDYDVNRYEDQFIPFRKYQISKVEKVIPVSQFAVDRIGTEYPTYKGLYLSRLGVENNGDNVLVDGTNFQIVSCSALIPLKRVHLIIEMLKELKLQVTWTHFGDGELMGELLELAALLPENITSNFVGHVDNSEVLDFYINKSVDLFINVSEYEGIPVSIMEAISFGIPVVGCSICGVPEIVNKETGFLIDLHFSPDKLATDLRVFLGKDLQAKKKIRQNVKNFWRRNFNAAENYVNFIEENLQERIT